jgi:hypothetical protein
MTNIVGGKIIPLDDVVLVREIAETLRWEGRHQHAETLNSVADRMLITPSGMFDVTLLWSRMTRMMLTLAARGVS